MNEIQRLWVSEYVYVCFTLNWSENKISQMIGQKSGCLSIYVMFYTLEL